MSDENKTDPPKQKPEEKLEPSNIEKYNLRKKIKQEIEDEKVLKKEEKSKAKQEDLWLKEAVEARSFNASPHVLELIKDLDLESQLVVLKANAERQEPNTSSLPTPIGREQSPLEKYMTFNPTKETIEYNIPASELMNRNKNKKLLGIEKW